MLRAWGYFIVQGFKNIGRHRILSMISVGIVAASLFLFGTLMLLQMNLTSVLEQVRDQCAINVYLDAKTDETARAEIEAELQSIQGVRDVRFCSKQERLDEVRETMYQGREAILEGMDEDNPLRDSYILETDKEISSSQISDAAREIAGVSEVTNLLDLEEKLQRLSRAAGKMGLWLLLLFAVAALFIMANAIRAAMVTRRGEIEIMRYVGASAGYICGPFVTEGIVLGICGGLIAAGLLLWGYRMALHALEKMLETELLHMVQLSTAVGAVLPAFLGLGIGIGALGSIAAMRKYLKA